MSCLRRICFRRESFQSLTCCDDLMKFLFEHNLMSTMQLVVTSVVSPILESPNLLIFLSSLLVPAMLVISRDGLSLLSVLSRRESHSFSLTRCKAHSFSLTRCEDLVIFFCTDVLARSRSLSRASRSVTKSRMVDIRPCSDEFSSDGLTDERTFPHVTPSLRCIGFPPPRHMLDSYAKTLMAMKFPLIPQMRFVLQDRKVAPMLLVASPVNRCTLSCDTNDRRETAEKLIEVGQNQLSWSLGQRKYFMLLHLMSPLRFLLYMGLSWFLGQCLVCLLLGIIKQTISSRIEHWWSNTRYKSTSISSFNESASIKFPLIRRDFFSRFGCCCWLYCPSFISTLLTTQFLLDSRSSLSTWYRSFNVVRQGGCILDPFSGTRLLGIHFHPT